MTLIIATILFFAVVALLVYVATETLPRWLFLRRQKTHRDGLRQFDITGEDDGTD